MRRLSSSLYDQVNSQFVRPAYLIEMDYKDNTTPLRFVSGIRELTLDGKTWLGQDIVVKGLGWEIKNSSRVSVEIQNVDSSIAREMLLNNVVDRPVKIWILYLHDRHIFYTDTNIVSGSSEISVKNVIPTHVQATGNLYYGATDLLSDTNYVAYTSIAGRLFNLSGTIPVNLPEGHPVYVLTNTHDIDDTVQIFDGVFDEIDLDEKSCVISLASESSVTRFTPRRRIIKSVAEPKFSILPQTGLKTLWGTELFTLEKAVY